MTKAELAALPKGTVLFVVSRKISRSGMRQTFDVFFISRERRPLWVRVNSEDVKAFNKKASVHACGSIEEDRRVGGSFYVNGCGFDRARAVVDDLARWATGDVLHFDMERI